MTALTRVAFHSIVVAVLVAGCWSCGGGGKNPAPTAPTPTPVAPPPAPQAVAPLPYGQATAGGGLPCPLGGVAGTTCSGLFVACPSVASVPPCLGPPGIWGGPRARTLACRYATAAKWIYDNVHTGGSSTLFAAQGIATRPISIEGSTGTFLTRLDTSVRFFLTSANLRDRHGALYSNFNLVLKGERR